MFPLGEGSKKQPEQPEFIFCNTRSLAENVANLNFSLNVRGSLKKYSCVVKQTKHSRFASISLVFLVLKHQTVWTQHIIMSFYPCRVGDILQYLCWSACWLFAIFIFVPFVLLWYFINEPVSFLEKQSHSSLKQWQNGCSGFTYTEKSE